MNTIIIDGYNFIFAVTPLRIKVLKDKKLGRDALIHMLEIYASSKKLNIKVVFDGKKGSFPRQRTQYVDVIYSKSPEIADDLIVDIVKKAKAPKTITVVTSDNELKNRVRSLGAQITGAMSFYSMIKKPQKSSNDDTKKPEIASKEEFDEWMEYFKGDEEK